MYNFCSEAGKTKKSVTKAKVGLSHGHLQRSICQYESLSPVPAMFFSHLSEIQNQFDLNWLVLNPHPIAHLLVI